MEKLTDLLQLYGKEKKFLPDQVLIQQGLASDGVYYLKQGKLGVYREEQNATHRVAEVTPGEMVGELGAVTGRLRMATVKAEEESLVIHISDTDFYRAMNEDPALVSKIIGIVGDRLVNAHIVRITLSQSYRQATDRAQTLDTQKAQIEELMRLREELADMIVHDLRSPLGVISNGLEMLVEILPVDVTTEHAIPVIGAMERSIQRMQRLVSTLLNIARLETEELLHFQPLDIHPLIKEVMMEQLPLAEIRSVTLQEHLPTGLPLVLADRDFIERVLVNLIDNALTYISQGGQVWMEAHPKAEQVQIEVIDTGPGIPLEDRERIFEKFTQVQRPIKARRGMGLGLAFCRMAVEAHGGRIWVEDGPQGKGSRFIFTLPTVQKENN
ncbi:MAG: cyclic nucleotide-binding domain-containing protein [Chloroflexi bacterium]|nr:cyclic nucleotide-binding domain-containing protein [Chloroflexota bacterium]